MNQAPAYRLLRRIGDSVYAEVYLVQAQNSGEQMVVKMLRQEFTSDRDVVERFLDEVRICQTSGHPHIVGHLSSGRAPDGRVFVVTEHLEGLDLRRLLHTRPPLTAEQLRAIAVPLCEALEHAHRHGLVHRDLKPENVFLAGGLRALDPRLLDFGVGLFKVTRARRTGVGRILGTPGYVAPECIGGQKPETRSDIYSLGCVMYEALTGRPVFKGDSDAELLDLHCSQEPPPLPATCAEFEPILQRCLAKTPAARFPDVEKLRLAIEELEEAALPLRSTHVRTTPIPLMRVFGGDEEGATLGNYQLEKLLGEGGMGRVFLARHVRLGKHVAIKVLRPEHSTNRDLLQRFFQEAHSVNQINHEHIVDIQDFVEEETPAGARAYCVMEFLAGRSLTEDAKRQPLTCARIVDVVGQMCEALHAAHQVGVVHRDIKPDNILLVSRAGTDDYVKVVDFGVAKLLSSIAEAPRSKTMSGVIIGTPAYMAPEQAAGRETDFRADIYAVGVVLYELLTGRLPFDAPTFGELFLQLATQPPPPLGAKAASGEPIPPHLASLVFACMEKDPAKRPASMAEVRARLAAGASARRPGRRGLAIAAGLALAAVLGVAGYSLVPVGAAGGSEPQVAAREELSAVPAPPATVMLALTSTPRGARVVRLDSGEELGATPLSVRLPKTEKTVSLRISLQGYKPVERTVRLSDDLAFGVVLTAVKGTEASAKGVRRPTPEKRPP